MANTVIPIVYGNPAEKTIKFSSRNDQSFPFMIAAPIIFMALVLFLGLFIPQRLSTTVAAAANIINEKTP